MTIRTAASLRQRLNVLWASGLVPGDSTGWDCIDELYTVAPGLVTVVTGWPGSGKSEWVDAVAMNLVKQDWAVVYYSPENLPIEQHLSKLAEKWTGKPFGKGPTPRMSYGEADDAAGELGDRVCFIESTDKALDIGEIVGQASEHFQSMPQGVKFALVIDPWNELDHGRPKDATETEYISQALGFVRRWARQWNAHVFIIAHPAKQPREQGKLPVPRPDMIAGSQHWWNKADQAVTVWRSYDTESQDVEIHVQKIRFKHHGRVGMATLKYDRVTGRYHEPMRDVAGRVYEYSFGGKG
jgi:twinkle protein